MKLTSNNIRIWKGGETMKIACLLVLASLVLASAACATNYQEVLYPHSSGAYGNNLIAMRGVPFDPDPISVFGDVNLIDGALSRLTPTSGNTETYFSFQEPGGPFGGMLLGDGYMIQVAGSQVTISYDGVADGVPDGAGQMTDMWVSLPGVTGREGGYHMVGHPFDHNVLWANVQVTDGTQTIPVMDAVNLGWLDGYWAYLDAPTQSTFNVDPDEIMGSAYMEPGRAYIVFTRKSNIALIIPAN